jgi:hypothetical protein
MPENFNDSSGTMLRVVFKLDVFQNFQIVMYEPVC